MKLILSAGFLATIFVVVFAQQEFTTPATASITSTLTSATLLPAVEDLEALLDKVAATSVEIKKAEEKKEQVTTQIIDWKQRLDRHNSNKCTYPEGQPDVCAAYEQKRIALNNERDLLKVALDENEGQTRTLMSRFRMLKARIRITTMLLYGCACEGLEAEAATACWSQCFDGANPRLKKCLDMPPSSVAACLHKLRHPENQ